MSTDQNILQKLEITTLFDVGANAGQFALQTRSSGYTGKIISFEPLVEAHQQLVSASAADPNWIIHQRCAVGDEPGSSVINVSRNSFSSSLLPMMDVVESTAPQAQYIDKQSVDIIRLEDVFDRYSGPDDRNFMKIDTQGFEAKVLNGAEGVLDRFSGLHVELAVVPLYEGGETFEYFVTRLKQSGFILRTMENSYTDPKTGQMLWFDGVFVRENLL